MAIITDLNCNLREAVKVKYLDGNLFSQDVYGNAIRVIVMDGDEPATLSGTVSGIAVRADGGSVAISDSRIDGNVATIVLPAAVYAIPGPISIVIKIADTYTVTTLAAVVTNVYQSSTDTVVDPGTIIPSINALIEQIAAATASIPADYSELWNSLAPTFNPGTSYVAGQYVTYNDGTVGKVYKFKNPHSGSWASADVDAVDLGSGITKNANDISDLKSALVESLVPTTLSNWESGLWAPTNGDNYADSNFIRNQKKVGVSNGYCCVSVPDSYRMIVYAWNGDTYAGRLHADGTIAKDTSSTAVLTSFSFSSYPEYLFKIAVRRNPASSDIQTSEGSNATFYKFMDESLSLPYKAPDSQVTGVAIKKRDNVFRAYISGNQTPTFSLDSNLKVKFPDSGSLYLFNPANGYLYTITCSGQEYTINGAATLRYNRTDGNLYNMAADYTDVNTLILLSVSLNGIDGILAPFFYQQEIRNAYLKGQGYAYFSGPSSPTFTIASDKTSLKITMPSSADLRIYTSNGLQITKSVAGESYSINRAGGRLIYDLTDSTIKNITSPANVNKNAVLLLSFNWFGCDGLLANYVKNVLNFDYKEATYPVLWKRKSGSIVKDDFSCVFLTDIHGQAKRSQQAIDFANAVENSPLSCIINGGDTVTLTQQDGITWWNSIVDSSSYPVLSAVGNHDATYSEGVAATAVQTYDLITAKVASTATITQPENAATNGYNYYYKDFNSKVRVIVIDPIYWDSEEITWFDSVLDSARTGGLAVVCVTHYPFKSELMEFPNLKRNYDAARGADYTPGEFVASVKGFIDAGGTFLCWMCGHTHLDGFGMMPNHGNQAVIMSTSQRIGADVSPAKSNDVRDRNYMAFDVIGVDLDLHIIKLARVGADLDWHNARHPRLTYNYVTHEVIEH